MPREKQRTLYSRNGIKILKTENILEKKYSLRKVLHREVLESNNDKCTKSHYEDVRYTSKLGFYYYKREFIVPKDPITKSIQYKKYVLQIGDIMYELEYPVSFESQFTNIKTNKYDTRPWDIVPGYKGIPDRFITILYNESLKFIDKIFEYKKLITSDDFTNIDDIRKEILCDLFGNEDGPKEQPNNIKILSHGFDLKESFRKRKET